MLQRGEIVRVETTYAIGCDWHGQTFPFKFIVQNVYYDGFEAHGWAAGNYTVDREHWGLVARRGHGGL